MIASDKGHYEVVKLLLEWKADPTIESRKGDTALNYLREYNLEQQDDATLDDAGSVFSHTTGYHTAASDISSIRSVPSNLSLDSLSDISSDKCDA
uniref:Uncharacterized protein n=1 Tax=Amphimedon queenslandica TaxID=400682 RepID=A0A1X7SP47_AMPQE